MEERGQLQVSSGSDEILRFTDEWVKDCVRLYFRPKTPTQYYAEGVKSQVSRAQSRYPDAHCPVPIFLLFDLAGLLCRGDCYFSDRGLGSHNYRILSTAEQLRGLNWRKIYHTGSTRGEEGDIPACRNAEVIVRGKLDLSMLKYVYCRSPAERETLLQLLPARIANTFQGRTLSSSKTGLFQREHTYVEQARLSARSVTLSFFPDTHSVGPFDLVVQFQSLSGDLISSMTVPGFYVSGADNSYQLRLEAPGQEYIVEVHLDDALIYANRYQEHDNPV